MHYTSLAVDAHSTTVDSISLFEDRRRLVSEEHWAYLADTAANS